MNWADDVVLILSTKSIIVTLILELKFRIANNAVVLRLNIGRNQRINKNYL